MNSIADSQKKSSNKIIKEKALEKKFGARYCCAVANGTAALHLTGLGLGWKPKDIVIASPISFLASANCIVYSGATPDFADIDEKTYTIDPNQLEKKIKSIQDSIFVIEEKEK